MNEAGDEILNAVTVLLPRLLGVLDTLDGIARRMHPPRLPDLARSIGDQNAVLADGETLMQAVKRLN